MASPIFWPADAHSLLIINLYLFKSLNYQGTGKILRNLHINSFQRLCYMKTPRTKKAPPRTRLLCYAMTWKNSNLAQADGSLHNNIEVSDKPQASSISRELLTYNRRY